MMLRTAILAALLSALVGCQRSARPDPRIDELSARMVRLEARHSAIEELIAKLDSTADDDSPGEEEVRMAEVSPERLDAKLDQMAAAINAIEERLAAGTPRPQPAKPDPSAVYSIPIKGAPYTGPRYAKVTIIQAYEYA